MAPTVIGGLRGGAISTTLNFAQPFINLSGTSTEALVQWPLRAPGFFSNWTISIDAVATARNSVWRKNGADTPVSISPPDGVSGLFRFPSVGVHYAAGDTFDVHDTLTGATGFTIFGHSTNFFGDAGTVGIYTSQAGATGTNLGQLFTTFGSGFIIGDGPSSRAVIRAPGAAKNLVVQVTSNTATSAVAVHSRKNGANGAMTATMPIGTTGFFEDTTNSDALVSGDLFGFEVDNVPVGAISPTIGCSILHSGVTSEVVGGDPVFNFNASPQFSPLLYAGSGAASASTTEANQPNQLNIDGKLSNMRVSSFTNTMTGASVLTLRKNGASQTQTVTIGAAATGIFEDTTHSDQFKSTDLLNYQMTGGTAGTLTTSFLFTTLTPFASSMRHPPRPYLRR